MALAVGAAAALWAAGADATAGNASPLADPAGTRLGFHPRVKPGIQVLLEKRLALLEGKRVGIITNPTGVLPNLQSDVDALAALKPKVQLVAIFGPEHGFRGTAQAGGSEGSYKDPLTGIPVYDLYGKNRDQIAEIFRQARVDLVLFDIQDVGARFYTYIWTMSDAMEAAALTGTQFVVLDRPNPIGGMAVQGPVLEPAYSSFVGRFPIAQRHGMTVGELALLFNDRFLPEQTGGVKARLTVIPMEGWQRRMYYEDTGLPWVMPSPNMPTVDTAVVYPGDCLFEGTNLSEGRGTTKPFQLLGAPYVDGRLAPALNGLHLPGVAFRAVSFTPSFDRYQGQVVNGVEVYVTDRGAYDPVRTAVAILVEVRRLYGTAFQWRFDSWDKVHPYWIDKLTGGDWVRKAIDAGKDADQVSAGWQDQLQAFRQLRAHYLLYPAN
ncbi:MAG: DUF1343 domain-containing protein [Firmicutes bacterium]|nr:DUF1343 domain-containing protein [Bacillota bacterium]